MLPSDFVIIGAGLAGISLGVRLTENPAVTVTVLEAGSAPFHDINIDTPAYLLNNLGNTTKDWSFFSIPQPTLDGRPVFLPRGKSIGGSTLINFMEVNRAASVEYDTFGSLGSAGWSWSSLLPFFKKAETLVNTGYDASELKLDFNSAYQGYTGPVVRTTPRFLDVVALPYIQAVQKALGIKYNSDPNTGDNTGAWVSTRTVGRTGIRTTAASSYYEPNANRPNLKVITGAQATKILTSASGGKNSDVVATGVQYLKDGKLVTIQAGKEVILSAGSYQSPQVLELSGIGDPTVLNKFSIPVVVNLPGVGNNLPIQEHVTATFTAQMTPGHDAWENMTDPTFAAQQEEIYKATGGGMLSGVPSAFAFLPFKDFDTDGSLAKLASTVSASGSGAITLTAQKEWVKNSKVPFLEINAFDRFQAGALAAPLPNTNYISSSVILLHPFSRGSVHLNSSSPTSAPRIDLNLLSSPVDVKILTQGYRLIRNIMRTAPLNTLFAKEVSPGPDVDTDEEIAAYLRSSVGTTFHPVGTAGMLPRKDGGVVDANFKVYGTSNLRVVDASVIPIEISAHLQNSLYAIAEKAASVIKSDCGV